MTTRTFLLTAILALPTLGAAGCAPAPELASAPAPAAAPPAAHAPRTTTPPPLGPPPTLRLPEPVRRTLANGLEVVYVRHGSLPVVHATLVVPAGASADPAALPGLAAFTAEMIDEGAGGRDALELSGALELLGATLSTGAGWDAAYVDLHVLRDRLPAALGLLADVVVRPDVPVDELSRVRDESLTELARAGDEPRIIAANAFTTLVFGAAHPYGRLATVETTRRFDREAVRGFHQARYRPDGSTLVVVGDVQADQLHPLVERALGGWSGTAPAVDAPPAPDAPAATTIFLVDKPGAAQSEIRIGHPAVARDHPDYFPLQVLNTVLGGSFTSRLNTNLRETHGFAYGAGSVFDMRRGAGPFLASSAVFTEKTDSALVEFFHELRRVRDEAVSQDELERARNYLALGFPRRFESSQGVAGQLAQLEALGLSPDVYNDFVPRIMAVTAADVQRVAREHLRPDRAVVVVVGDRARIEPGLRALGIGPLETREITEFVR